MKKRINSVKRESYKIKLSDMEKKITSVGDKIKVKTPEFILYDEREFKTIRIGKFKEKIMQIIAVRFIKPDICFNEIGEGNFLFEPPYFANQTPLKILTVVEVGQLSLFDEFSQYIINDKYTDKLIF